MMKSVGGDCNRTNQSLDMRMLFMPMYNGAMAIAPYEVLNVKI